MPTTTSNSELVFSVNSARNSDPFPAPDRKGSPHTFTQATSPPRVPLLKLQVPRPTPLREFHLSPSLCQPVNTLSRRSIPPQQSLCRPISAPTMQMWSSARQGPLTSAFTKSSYRSYRRSSKTCLLFHNHPLTNPALYHTSTSRIPQRHGK